MFGRLWYSVARRSCKVFCKLCFRFRVYGLENIPDQGAFLLISNHQSYLDPLFCGSVLQRQMYYLARDSLFRNRFFGWLIRSVNTMPVRLGKTDMAAIRNVISKLKQGNGVLLFPEGTRTSDGKIAALKSGFGLLSRKGRAAVVPVVIDGAFECWPREKKMFSIRHRITVRYGQPILSEQTKELSDDQLAEKLTGILRRMQTNIRIQQDKQPYDYTS